MAQKAVRSSDDQSQPPASQAPAQGRQHQQDTEPWQGFETCPQGVQEIEQDKDPPCFNGVEEVDGDPVNARLPVGRGGEGEGIRQRVQHRESQTESRGDQEHGNGQNNVCVPGQKSLGFRRFRPFQGNGLAQPVEHNGDDDDGEARLHGLADLQGAERQQHVIAKATCPDHRRDDDHVEGQHDHLVHANQQGGLGRRQQHAPQLLRLRAARHVGEILDLLWHLVEAKHGGPHHGRRGEKAGGQQGGHGACAKQQQHGDEIGEGRHRLHEVEGG